MLAVKTVYKSAQMVTCSSAPCTRKHRPRLIQTNRDYKKVLRLQRRPGADTQIASTTKLDVGGSNLGPSKDKEDNYQTHNTDNNQADVTDCSGLVERERGNIYTGSP